MKTKISATLCALFIGLLATAQGPLTVKGKILGNSDSQPTLEVLVNGTDLHEVPLSKSGKFQVNLYDEDRYVFTFSQKGCIEKTVIIDTSMPGNEIPVGKLVFDVSMEPSTPKAPEAILCAIYTYSSNDNSFVYNAPPSEIEGIAENGK